jgi:AcrR family transcriptional regulator
LVERKRLSREESRAETKRRLLDAAERVFAERGFAGASVEEIADTAGFSRGAFYSNFADKAMAAEVAALADEASDVTDFFAKLRQRAGGRTAERSWIMLSLEFSLYALRTPKVGRKLAELERTERDAYANVIQEQLSALGVESAVPLSLAALVVQAVERGMTLQHHLDPKHVPAEAVFDALVFLLTAATAGRR